SGHLEGWTYEDNLVARTGLPTLTARMVTGNITAPVIEYVNGLQQVIAKEIELDGEIHRWTYAYNQRGQLVEQREPAVAHRVESNGAHTPLDVVTRYRYDSLGRQVSRVVGEVEVGTSVPPSFDECPQDDEVSTGCSR